MLLRVMQQHPGKLWRHPINALFRSLMSRLKKTLAEAGAAASGGDERQVYSDAAAVLWVLGGGSEILRIGAKVCGGVCVCVV